MTDVIGNVILDLGLVLGGDVLIHTEKAIIVDVASAKVEAEYRYKSGFWKLEFLVGGFVFSGIGLYLKSQSSILRLVQIFSIMFVSAF